MVHIAESKSINRLRLSVDGAKERVSDAIQRHRRYTRTKAELNALSTRELDDLGISRSMISRLAHEVANNN